jgi:50S ribosome-binding GTPase
VNLSAPPTACDPTPLQRLVDRLHAAASVDPMSLTLARAALHVLMSGSAPPQVAVIGPTQTGKSTIANCLLGQELAGVSPLAGFTVHCQGFAGLEVSTGWMEAALPGRARRARAELSRDELDCYSLERAAGPRPLAAVVWDTPDFDSLAAAGYRGAVLDAAAAADVVVVVSSAEKYSDQSLWTILELIAPLGRPLVFCLNKLSPPSDAAIREAFQARMRERGLADRGNVLTISMAGAISVSQRDAEIAALQQAVARALASSSRAAWPRGVAALIRGRWDAWMMPVRLEHAAQREFAGLVEDAIGEVGLTYRRDYLDHPQRYDTFRRTTAELLDLLELPAVGSALAGVRRIVTWPARQVLAAARQMLRPAASSRANDSEEQVIESAVERLLTRLECEAGRRASPDVADGRLWRGLAEVVREKRSAWLAQSAARSRAARDAFAPQIRAAADALYESIRGRPALLNTLRAARAATDVASVALAIKTGGAAAHDLVLAPAMFSLTSLIAEGALGSYMARVAEDLRNRQREHMQREVFAPLAADVRQAWDELESRDRLNITQAEVDAALAELDAMERA